MATFFQMLDIFSYRYGRKECARVCQILNTVKYNKENG